MEITSTHCTQCGDRVRVDGMAREAHDSAWIPFTLDLTDILTTIVSSHKGVKIDIKSPTQNKETDDE